MHWNLLARKSHRWGAIIMAVPFLVVLITGIMLQLKKQIPWVQPPTQRGQAKVPSISFEQILNVVRSVPEAEVAGWADIDRMDVQPARGIVKVQTKSRWEIQIDTKTAEILQVAYRRSDVIEAIHDGSWFHEAAKLWVFLPSAVIVLGLWVTGLYLFGLPLWVKWRRKKSATINGPTPPAGA